MGFFSSTRNSSSSVVNTTNQDQTISNVDNRLVRGSNNLLGGNFSSTSAGSIGDVSIEQTDLGLLDAAKRIANQSLNVLGEITSINLETAERLATPDSIESTNKIITGLVIVGSLFAAKGFLK